MANTILKQLFIWQILLVSLLLSSCSDNSTSPSSSNDPDVEVDKLEQGQYLTDFLGEFKERGDAASQGVQFYPILVDWGLDLRFPIVTHWDVSYVLDLETGDKRGACGSLFRPFMADSIAMMKIIDNKMYWMNKDGIHTCELSEDPLVEGTSSLTPWQGFGPSVSDGIENFINSNGDFHVGYEGFYTWEGVAFRDTSHLNFYFLNELNDIPRYTTDSYFITPNKDPNTGELIVEKIIFGDSTPQILFRDSSLSDAMVLEITEKEMLIELSNLPCTIFNYQTKEKKELGEKCEESYVDKEGNIKFYDPTTLETPSKSDGYQILDHGEFAYWMPMTDGTVNLFIRELSEGYDWTPENADAKIKITDQDLDDFYLSDFSASVIREHSNVCNFQSAATYAKKNDPTNAKGLIINYYFKCDDISSNREFGLKNNIGYVGSDFKSYELADRNCMDVTFLTWDEPGNCILFIYSPKLNYSFRIDYDKKIYVYKSDYKSDPVKWYEKR